MFVMNINLKVVYLFPAGLPYPSLARPSSAVACYGGWKDRAGRRGRISLNRADTMAGAFQKWIKNFNNFLKHFMTNFVIIYIVM